MIYVKVEFNVIGENDETEQQVSWWAKTGHSSLGAAAYAAENLATGYYIGSAQRASVITVTRQDPGEPTLSIEELRAALEAASA